MLGPHRLAWLGWVALVGCGLIGLTGCSAPDRSQPAPAASSGPASSAAPPRASAPPSHSSGAPTRSPEASDTPVPAAAALIDHVRWSSTDQGRQLQVFPTPAGRGDHSGDGEARAWAEVETDARVAGASADTAGMADQFRCHWDFARIADPDKASWNLEPWRPAVGYPATVAAQCNPGGPES